MYRFPSTADRNTKVARLRKPGIKRNTQEKNLICGFLSSTILKRIFVYAYIVLSSGCLVQFLIDRKFKGVDPHIPRI